MYSYPEPGAWVYVYKTIAAHSSLDLHDVHTSRGDDPVAQIIQLQNITNCKTLSVLVTFCLLLTTNSTQYRLGKGVTAPQVAGI